MLYMATVSFSGIIAMHKGEVREISDPSLVEDLTKAGYIIKYEATKNAKTEKSEVAEDDKPKTKRKVKNNG